MDIYGNKRANTSLDWTGGVSFSIHVGVIDIRDLERNIQIERSPQESHPTMSL